MLGRGEKVKIASFGNFVPHNKGSWRGRTPQTGESLILAERRVLVFKASQILKIALNLRDSDQASAAEK